MKEITKKNMLDWLEDARLSAAARLAALGDGEEERVQDSPEAREVCIINAIAERVREMSAVEYGKLHDEICDAYQHCMCASCPLGNDCISLDSYGDDIRRAVEIMKMWKEEQENAD